MGVELLLRRQSCTGSANLRVLAGVFLQILHERYPWASKHSVVPHKVGCHAPVCKVARDFKFPLCFLDLFCRISKRKALAAARNFRLLRQRGRTVRKTIDGLIATFCLRQSFSLLHCDRDYNHFEVVLGLSVIHP
jgi:hypothetical protein